MTEYDGPARSPLDEDRIYPLLSAALDRVFDGSISKSSALALYDGIMELTEHVRALQNSHTELSTSNTAEIIRSAYIIGALAAVPGQIRQIEKDQQKKRGQKSGNGRAERAKRGWMAHARELAIAIRQDKPSIAREPLAMEIILTWKDETSAPKSPRRMVDVLKEMERDGVIPTAQPLAKNET